MRARAELNRGEYDQAQTKQRDIVRVSKRHRGDDRPVPTSRVDRVICPCGKIGFVSEAVALERMSAIRSATLARTTAPRRALPVRVYQCPRSEAWHLTSTPKTSKEPHHDRNRNR